MRIHRVFILLAIAAIAASVSSAATLPQLLDLQSTFEFPPTAVGATTNSNNPPSVQNPEAASVVITSVSVAGSNASDFSASAGTCPLSPSALSGGQYCFLNLSFHPSAGGLRTARVIFQVAGGATQSLLLTGQGTAALKVVTLGTATVTFGATPLGLTQPPFANVNVRSTGDSPVTFTSVVVKGTEAASFPVSMDTCSGQTVAPQSFCSFSISFTPATAGLLSAAVQINDNTPSGHQIVPVDGLAIAPASQTSVTPADVVFADTGMGDSGQVQIGIQNTGSDSVTLGAPQVSGSNAGDFGVVANSCSPTPFTLKAQTNCSMTLQFSPSALGTRIATLTFPNSAAPNGNTVLPAQGFGVTPSLLLGLFGTTNWGIVPVAVAFTTQLTISSSGPAVEGKLALSGANASDFALSTTSCNMQANFGQCSFNLTFTAAAAGLRTANLTLTDSLTGLSQSFPLAGDAYSGSSPIDAQGPVLGSVAVGAESPAVYVAIQNTSASSISISGVSLSGPNQSDFAIYSNECFAGWSLGAGQQCSVAIDVTPSAVGARIGILDVSYNNGAGMAAVPLVATGVANSRQISLPPQPVTFPAQALGSSSTQTATVLSTGNEAVAISSVSVAGAAASDYVIVENQCPQAPAVLAPGANCQVTLQFTPSAAGTRDAIFQVADNATGSPQNTAIYGFGGAPAPAANLWNSTPFPSSLVPLGSSVQAVYTMYSGSTPVAISQIAVTGPNAADFSQSNNCPASLPANSSCLIYVTFQPTVTGLRLAELTVTDNATGSPQAAPLSGIGVTDTTTVAFLQGPVDFGQTALAYPSTQSVVVTNSGSENVLITGTQIAGINSADFGISSNTCPLSPAPLLPGQYCFIDLSFSPAALGVRLGTLKLSDNATGSPQAITLVGVGLPDYTALNLTISSAPFGPTTVGTTTYGFSFEIRNAGTATVTITGIQMSGADPADFNFQTNSCLGGSVSGLPPGGYCNLDFSFTPTATGTRTATFTVTSNAGNGPQTIQLTGTGQ